MNEEVAKTMKEVNTINKEIIKAINKKEENNKLIAIRKWWRKNSYKIARIVLFPIWIIYLTNQKIQNKLNSHEKWSEEKANEILSYYIPRRCNWEEANKTLYFFDNGYGWSFNCAKKYLKRKDYRFWKLYSGCFGGQIRRYLIDSFEIENFKKEIENCYDSQTEISFKMIESEE